MMIVQIKKLNRIKFRNKRFKESRTLNTTKSMWCPKQIWLDKKKTARLSLHFVQQQLAHIHIHTFTQIYAAPRMREKYNWKSLSPISKMQTNKIMRFKNKYNISNENGTQKQNNIRCRWQIESLTQLSIEMANGKVIKMKTEQSEHNGKRQNDNTQYSVLCHAHCCTHTQIHARCTNLHTYRHTRGQITRCSLTNGWITKAAVW